MNYLIDNYYESRGYLGGCVFLVIRFSVKLLGGFLSMVVLIMYFDITSTELLVSRDSKIKQFKSSHKKEKKIIKTKLY